MACRNVRGRLLWRMSDAKVIPISAAAMKASEEKILEWLETVDDEPEPDLDGLELVFVHQGKLIRELRRDLDDLRDKINHGNWQAITVEERRKRQSLARQKNWLK